MGLPQKVVNEDDEIGYNAKQLSAREEANSRWGMNPESDQDKSAEESDNPVSGTEKKDRHLQSMPTGDDVEEKPSGGDAPETLFTFKNSKKAVNRFKIKRLNFKKKVLISLFASSSLFLIIVIGVLLSFFSTQKILQLAEHMAVYNLAQVSRTLRTTESGIIEENVASETIDGNLYQTLKTRFGETKLSSAIDSFNALRPSKVFKNLNSNFEPFYTTTGETVFGTPKKTFQGWNYTDGEGNVSFVQKADTKFFHPFSNNNERIRVGTEFEAVMEKDLQGYKTYIRGPVVEKILADKGIKLKWWNKLGKDYGGLTQEAAERLAQQDALKAISSPPESSCVTQSICDAVKETEDATKKSVDESVNNKAGGGAASVKTAVDDATKNALDSAVKTSVLEKSLSTLSIINAVAVPLCLIYDGSIENAQGSIDANTKALEKTYFSVTTAADQQKSGDTTPEAIGAFGGKLGDYSNSIPELRASGKTVDTAAYVNPLELPQSSASGSYSLINATIGDGPVIDVLNKILSKGCGFITDLKTQTAAAALELIAALFTDGGSTAAEASAKTGVDLAVENLGKRLLFTETRNMIKEKGLSYAAKQTVGKFIIKTGIQVGVTLGLTELAKLAVLKHMGTANTGLDTDATFANQADMGSVAFAQNDMGRNLLYGRPMTTPEVAQANMDNIAYLNDLNSRKSFQDRYLALNNPSSLFSKLGFSSYTYLSKPDKISTKILGSLTNVFSTSFKLLSELMLGKTMIAHAQSVTGAGDYNMVHWGWSSEEEQLIASNPDLYAPMINNLILEESGKEAAIQAKYGKCYTASVGSLLGTTDPSILRNTDGSVITNAGLCSPDNLGSGNNEFGDHMVFRWRLKNRNGNVRDQFVALASPQASSATAPPTLPVVPPAPITTPTAVTATGLNGYTIPCAGQPAPVPLLSGPRADWSNAKDSGTIGENSAGNPIKVYIREACDKTNLKTVIIVGSIHGSENGGQLVAWDLLFNAKLSANTRIIAIPELNGTGIAANARKNSNGVDLNRNEDLRWGQASPLSKCSESSPDCSFYHGSSAASEPETKAIDTFLLSVGKANLFVVYHDNLNYVAPVGDTSVGIGDAYARVAGSSGQGTGAVGKTITVTQHGSLDGWYNAKTGAPTILVELSNDQSSGVIKKHVDAILQMLQDGTI